MANTFNSVSAIIDTTVELQQQVLQALTMITESLTTAQETVTISYLSNGTTTEYEIPSFGFIKSEITRIDNNIKLLSGFNTGEVNLRQPDGTYQRIYMADIIDSPVSLTNLPVPTTFSAQNNWFFESFLNPLLYVSVDVTNQIDQDTERVMKKRVILKDDLPATVLFFDTYLNGKNNIDYNSIFALLQANNIAWFIDDDTIDLPVNSLQYTGNFDVTYITDVIQATTVNGQTVNSKVRLYTLASLTYTDTTDILKNTQTLKVGDQIVSGTTSRYQIVTIDTSTNQISVLKVSGFESIKIGAASIRVYSEANPNRSINVNIGHDERQIIFFKPINRQTNIAALNWSQGIAFYSSDLSMTAGNTNLDEYYQQVVTDFGSYFLSIAKEKVVPSVLGLTPTIPTIELDNFQVVQINTHITDTTTNQQILNLASEKTSLESTLSQLDVSIAQTKAQLGNTNFVDATDRNTVANSLDALITQKTSQSNLYSSIVTQLVTLGSSNPNTVDPPKYHIRGFWPIPDPQTTTQTGNQEIIQFIIQYRYIRPDGNTSGVVELDFTDSTGTVKRAFFSNWNEVRTGIRTKSYDVTTGRYVWNDEDVSDPDAININSLDIPITAGEQVEIRIMSVSEAGWPLNPLTSDWSTTITVPFPANLAIQDPATAAIADATADQSVVAFQNTLTSLGVDQHLEDSIIINDQYYAHGAARISSGYFDSNNNVISLLQKLQDLDLQIATLNALITNAKGTLAVTIVDSSGNTTQISNNSTIDIFAGYYQDIVSAMATSDQKGAIVTKVFYIGLSNSAASVLELMSIYSGAFGDNVPPSATSGDKYAPNAYDKAAMILNTTSTFGLNTVNQPSPFQSGQVKSQYLYLRGYDMSLKNSIFDTPATGTTYSEPLNVGVDTSAATPFVWSGTGTAGNGVISQFSISTSHPALTTGVTLAQLQDEYTTTNQIYPTFRHSAFFNLQSSDPNGAKQLQYTPSDGTAGRGKYPAKLGFYADDRYLIGANTCGSYLFLAPNKYSDIQVNGNDSNAVQTILFGDQNSIRIPLVFQFRMTDYYGANATDPGLVGGWNTSNSYPQNLTYSKLLGFDISVLNDTTFSFDISVTTQYAKTSLSQFTVTGGSSTTIVI